MLAGSVGRLGKRSEGAGGACGGAGSLGGPGWGLWVHLKDLEPATGRIASRWLSAPFCTAVVQGAWAELAGVAGQERSNGCSTCPPLILSGQRALASELPLTILEILLWSVTES